MKCNPAGDQVSSHAGDQRGDDQEAPVVFSVHNELVQWGFSSWTDLN